MGKDLQGKELGKGITQRKDGRYQARFTNRYGKREYVYGMTLKEVKNALMSEVVDDYTKNNVISPNMTLNQWYEKWMRVYKAPTIKNTTLREYKCMYQQHIQNTIGNMKIVDISRLAIQELFNDLGKKKKKGTAQNCSALLSSMFDSAVANDLCKINPVKGVKVTGLEKKEIVTLSRQDQYDFFTAAKNSRYYNCFVVQINTGLRVGEVVSLTLDDVDFKKNVIYVRKTLVYLTKNELDGSTGFAMNTPKTKTAIRTVPMNEMCRKAIQDQIIQNKYLPEPGYSVEELGELLFTTKNNKPILGRTYSDAIHTIIKKVNKGREKNCEQLMPVFNSHTFRHTFATRCFEAGMPAKTVQSILGHTTLNMTLNVYTAVCEDKKIEDMKLLEETMKDIVNF